MDFSVLQKGQILFFCRPRVEHKEIHNPEDVQHFFIVLKPEMEEHFIFIVVGRKKLPEYQPYFGFVEKIAANLDQAMTFLSEEHYVTLTKGEREVSAARYIGMGKYLFIGHEQHTHLIYELSKPSKLSEIQKEFHLKKRGDYLITVKNPLQPSPHGVGLASKQKAQYPEKLQHLFQDYRFISLTSMDFLKYEGTELLLIGKASSSFKKNSRDLSQYFKEIKEENVYEHFAIYRPNRTIAH